MRVLIVVLALIGELTFYNPNVMEAVYRNRLAWGHVQPCEECIGMVALLDCNRLGDLVAITRPGRPAEGPFLVTDCAAAHDYQRLKTRGLVGEVDNRTARRWQMTGPLRNVRITTYADPTRHLPAQAHFARTHTRLAAD